MPLDRSTYELMLASTMEERREQAQLLAKELTEKGFTAPDFVMALPFLLIGAMETFTKMRGEEMFKKLEAEAYEMTTVKHNDGRYDTIYANQTVPHALYRLFDDSRVLATAVAKQVSLHELFRGDMAKHADLFTGEEPNAN